MPLDIFQQTFTLAMLADKVIDQKGTLEELQKYYYDALTSESGLKRMEGWDLVWGPTIWKLEPDAETFPGNAGYIAFHPGAKFDDGVVCPTYVIAITGTPMGCKYVVEKEDNAVDSVVDFNGWVKGGIKKAPVTISSKDVQQGTSYFSRGMAWATHNLMNAVPFNLKDHVVRPGETMVQFLSSLKPTPTGTTRFIVTGHSLGGTLTTTISLTLVTAGTLAHESTRTYPAAACSAGNLDWARQWAEKFPASKSADAHSYQGWNLNLVNNMDCVPQLWCQIPAISPQQWLGRIPSIYGLPIVDKVWQTYAVEYPTSASSSGVVYKPVPAQYFDASPPISVPITLEAFSKELAKQHGKPYMDEVGISVGVSDATIALKAPTLSRLQEVMNNPEAQKKSDGTMQTQLSVHY